MSRRFNIFSKKTPKVHVKGNNTPEEIEAQIRADNEIIAKKALASAKQKLRDGVITPQEYAELTDPTRKSSIQLGLARANKEAGLHSRMGGKGRRRTHKKKGKKHNKTHKRRALKKTHKKKGKKNRKTHRRRH